MNTSSPSTSQVHPLTIAYLAPEIPALSATFVYEEILALKRQGVRVFPYSVHTPSAMAEGQQALVASTVVLYQAAKWRLVAAGLMKLTSLPQIAPALAMLWKDIRSMGVWRLGSAKLFFQFTTAAVLADDLRSKEVDHLHVHFAHVPSQIGMYASALSGIPFSITAHANDIFERGLLLREKAIRAFKFLTISEFNRKHLAQLGLPEAKLQVVRCGVSFSRPFKLPSVGEKSVYRVGTLGRLVEKKGMADLISAIEILAHKKVAVQVDIAGDGPLSDALRKHAKEKGLQANINFLGSLTHNKVSEWMAGLDLFVLACKADGRGDMDGIPVVLMEAMSQGVPVVSTRISGIPELVIHKKTGLLALPDDPADLAKQIEAALSSPLDRAAWRNSALTHVEAEFGQSINIQRLLSIFNASA